MKPERELYPQVYGWDNLWLAYVNAARGKRGRARGQSVAIARRDSYANRVGKGTHRALDRCQQFARRYRYVLQCDVKQSFPSIDHATLRETLNAIARTRPLISGRPRLHACVVARP